MNSFEALTPRQATVLVVGLGHGRLGDAAVGAAVARALAVDAPSGVATIAVPRLSLDLAAALAETKYVVFVDAHNTPAKVEPRLEPITPLAEGLRTAYIGDPQSLLTLTASLYGYSPAAWLLMIPASEFAHPDTLSSITSHGKVVALRLIHELLDRLAPQPEVKAHTVGSSRSASRDGSVLITRR